MTLSFPQPHQRQMAGDSEHPGHGLTPAADKLLLQHRLSK